MNLKRILTSIQRYPSCIFFWLIIFVYLPQLASAQQIQSDDAAELPTPAGSNINRMCRNDLLLYQLRKNPDFVAKEAAMNQAILNAYRMLPGDTLTLPVVVHIINSDPNSVTDAEVIAGIADLNDAFSKSGNYAASLGADTKIRFCLSRKDPDGGNTNGITRTTSFLGEDHNMDTEERDLKELIQWDPLRYINIWLVSGLHGEIYTDFLCGNWFRLQVGGYATLPPGGGPLDGIVIGGFGKVLAHEMGHYLSLYHTFENGCANFDCQLSGDFVCDTPPDNSVRGSVSCSFPQNSCSTDTLSSYSNGFFPADVRDQISNFMDYSNDPCTNQFTQGQADRMRAAILTLRPGLLQDECSQPCVSNIVAGFTKDVEYPITGGIVNFTNTSIGATTYEWLVDGTVIATSTDFNYTFTIPGKYNIVLKAYASPGCFASCSNTIIVNCGVTSRFFTNKRAIASLAGVYTDSIVFTNTSYNGASFQWLVSNDAGLAEQIASTDTNMTYVFLAAATYSVRLIATNGSCSDTSATFSVSVANPTADAYTISLRATCYQQNKVSIRFCMGNVGYAPIPAGTPVTFYDNNPALPTANKLLPVYYLPFDLSGYCTNCFTHILNVNYRGLENIYMVINDSGNAIPVSLPNTSLPEKLYVNNIINTFPNRRTVSATICEGDNYAGYTVSGTYIDTLASVLNGCDSIRTLLLTVKPSPRTTITRSICQGDNYQGYTTSGTYTDIFTAANGCDSTRILNLTVKPRFNTIVNATICLGENYAGYTSSGNYVDIFTAANGCDSTRTLNLIVKPTVSTAVSAEICQGENYAGHTTTGTYTDVYTAANGCDSTRTLQLLVKPNVSTSVSAEICDGENYAGHTTTGTYIDVYTSANGCDSTRTLQLLVKPNVNTTYTIAICQGENYAGHNSTGTYTDVYSAANGCDSTRLLHLTVKPTVSTTITSTVCQGTSVAGYSTSGTYTDVFTAANGCDSTRTLQLTVNPTRLTVVPVERCRGVRYYAGGAYQTESGTYYDTTLTYLGCDSVIKTILTIHPLPEPELGEDKRICRGDVLQLNPGNFTTYLWQNGASSQVLDASTVGLFTVSVTNQFGCRASDSMSILEIYPLPANFLPDDSTICRGNVIQITVPGYDEYTWNNGSHSNTININRTDLYKLTVKDDKGCIGKDSIKVIVKNCINIQMPNAFTPNNDNLNDVFKAYVPSPVTNFRMQIWNVWGEKVFETTDYKRGWDGTYKSVKQSMGSYVYLVTLKDIDGKPVQKKGSFVLIR